jgi:hypothetical protein
MNKVRLSTHGLLLSKEHWVDDTALVRFLGNQMVAGRLALVLGAGISMPFGLPNWPTLLQELRKVLKTDPLLKGNPNLKDDPPPNWDLKRLAEDLRIIYEESGGTTQGFLDHVSSALYSNHRIKVETLLENRTLAALGAFVMSSKRGRAGAVISFNYDDLLEYYLDYHGSVVVSISADKYWAPSADVVIYHPHGFLPKFTNRTRSDDLVLDQESYSKAVGSKELWWEQIRLLLRQHFCIFIGLSGNDDNLDSMLREVNEAHPAKVGQLPFWGLSFTATAEDPMSRILSRRGIYLKRVNSFDDLPEFLFAICREAASLIPTR